MNQPHSGRVVPVRDLCDYFRGAIDAAMAQQAVSVDTHTTHYVVNMMTLFSRSENLYTDDDDTRGIKPLALMLADAADATSSEHRNQLLQRIGDVALFVSGFFADGFATKAVDIDYYIYMGESAYASLSDEVRGTFRGNAFADLYGDLARKFRVLIDILHEVRDGTLNSSGDILKTYELWRKTGSRRAEKLLRKQQVIPIGNGFRH